MGKLKQAAIGIPHYCPRCDEMLGDGQMVCPFCDRDATPIDEHDRLEAQYDAMKARKKAKDHADAFMQGWMRAKLHSSTLEDAFEAWRVCDEPGAPSVDVMLRKLGQIRKLALSAEGHGYDLIIALADEAMGRRIEANKS